MRYAIEEIWQARGLAGNSLGCLLVKPSKAIYSPLLVPSMPSFFCLLQAQRSACLSTLKPSLLLLLLGVSFTLSGASAAILLLSPQTTLRPQRDKVTTVENSYTLHKLLVINVLAFPWRYPEAPEVSCSLLSVRVALLAYRIRLH